MAHDLSELLLAEIAADSHRLAALPGPDVSSLAARARRLRRARQLRLAAVVVPAAVLLGAGTWWGIGELTAVPPPATQEPAPTAPPPTSSPTLSPTPTATTEPSSTPTPDPEPVTELGLPTYLPAPDGLVAQTGPGWVATTHRPRFAADVGGQSAVTTVTHAVLLVAPDGTTYRMPDPPQDLYLEVLRWGGGDPLVRVVARAALPDDAGGGRDSDAPAWVGWYDLETGDFAPETQIDQADRYLGADGRGEWWWRAADAGVWQVVESGGEQRVTGAASAWALDLNPAGTVLVDAQVDEDEEPGIRFVDLTSGEEQRVDMPSPGRQCDVLAWLDDEGVLVACRDPREIDYDEPVDSAALGATLHRVARDGPNTLLYRLGSKDLLPSRGAYLAAGVAALAGAGAGVPLGPDGCTDDVAVWDGTAPVPAIDHGSSASGFATVYEVSGTGGLGYVQSVDGCAGDESPFRLDAVSADGVARTVVAGIVPQTDAEGRWWAEGLTSWAAAQG